MDAAVTPRYLTVRQAAQYLGRTEQAIRDLIKTRDIPHHRHGRRISLDVQALDLWMARHRVDVD